MKDYTGAHATDGTIPAGKWGIAGEAGPEIITGPATVTPMGGGGGARVVINNNASGLVDLQAREDALSGRIIVTVNSMIAANNRKAPGLVTDSQKGAVRAPRTGRGATPLLPRFFPPRKRGRAMSDSNWKSK